MDENDCIWQDPWKDKAQNIYLSETPAHEFFKTFQRDVLATALLDE